MASGLYAAAAALAVVFVIRLVRRLRMRYSPVYGWWTLSFAFYALSFVMEAVTVGSHWRIWEYQLYIMGSAGLVGAMSAGTVYLARPRSWIARGYAIYVGVVELALIGFTLASPPVLHGSWAMLNSGQHAIVGWPRVAYLLLSAVGGPIVVLSTGWSWWKTRKHPVLLIAVGALIPTVAGTLASQGITTAVFPLLNIVGLVLIFIGYLHAGPSSPQKTSAAA